MESVSSAEFSRQLGKYQDRALVEPVMVTKNGRERLVLMSAEEFRRLRRQERRSLAAWELSPRELQAIAAARMPAEYNHLDAELGSS